jgi:hypothetical protein
MPDQWFVAGQVVYVVVIAGREPPRLIAGHYAPYVYANRAEAYAQAQAWNDILLATASNHAIPFAVCAVTVKPPAPVTWLPLFAEEQ